MEQVVGHNGVVHAHAALVKNTHDRLSSAEFACKRTPNSFVCSRDFHEVEGYNMPKVVLNGPFLQPLAKAPVEKIVLEIHTPQGAEGHPSFCKRAVKVEHPYQTGPLTAPVGYRKDGALMRGQPGQHMVRILPYAFGNDHRCIGRNVFKYFNTHSLGIDKSMLLGRIINMRPCNSPPLPFHSL